MPSITEFKINSVNLIEKNIDQNLGKSSIKKDFIKFSFSFVKNDPDESGYELFRSIDNNVELIEQFIDQQVLEFPDQRFSFLNYDNPSSINYNEKIRFFTVELPIENNSYGKSWVFYLKVYKKDGSGSYIIPVSEWVSYNVPLSKITDLVTYFDGFSFNLEWSKPHGDLLQSYTILYCKMKEVFGVKLFENSVSFSFCLFNSKEFKVGDFIVVYNNITKYYWSGTVLFDGEFFINSSNLLNNISFYDYESFGVENYTFYKCTESDLKVFQNNINKNSLSAIFNSDEMNQGDVFAFKIRANGGTISHTSNFSFSVVNSVINQPIIVYPIYESFNESYGNLMFAVAKNSLVDENYYNKDVYALPYIENTGGQLILDLYNVIDTGGNYNIRGFVGVYNAEITLHINNGLTTYSFKTLSDKKGEYSIDFNCPEKEFSISITGTVKGKDFLPYFEVPFYKILAYSHFGAMSRISKRVLNEMYNLAKEKSISVCSNKVLQTYYGNLIGISPDPVNESSYNNLTTEENREKFSKYREQIQFLYPILYTSSDPGLIETFNTILNFYVNSDYGIVSYLFVDGGDIFKTYYNSMNLNESLVVGDGTLENKKYTYYVTHYNSGKESYYESISIDYRIFNGPNTPNYPPISFTWNSVGNATSTYRIYRKDGNGNIMYLDEVTGLAYVDDGKKTPVNTYTPPKFGYMDIIPVRGLKFIGNGNLLDILLFDSYGNFLILVLYEKNAGDIPQYIIDRLYYIIRGMLPREIYFTIKTLIF